MITKKMLKYLVEYEDMSYEEAADYVCYNTLRALPYIHGNKPIVMYPLID